MLFKPRTPRTILYRARNIVWPRAGWGRTLSYLRHRVARLPGSPESIALGLACGIAISFTPLIGFHFLVAALLAWAMGGNFLASALGTAFGNPWTFPLIWLWIFKLGTWILGAEADVSEELTQATIRDNIFDIFLPMLVGGIPTAIVVWFGSYYPLKYVIRSYRRARRHRVERMVRQRMIRRKGMMAAGKEPAP
ncbi:MAG: DUF2062 domain-containing protein [Proteobacteria bacterium]|nr:DUF2062 domain-containing protein [Pseudomonadota bacterium]MDA1058932.1 DUF2062 domain-containing protein [Pseudomonadota bacterium]